MDRIKKENEHRELVDPATGKPLFRPKTGRAPKSVVSVDFK